MVYVHGVATTAARYIARLAYRFYFYYICEEYTSLGKRETHTKYLV